MLNFYDQVNFRMTPCTTHWAHCIDTLAEKGRPGVLAAHLVGPLAVFPLLVDAALHLSACALKTIYAFVTGTLELITNAFTDTWIACNPLKTYYWSRAQAVKHFAKALTCTVVGLAAIPAGFVVPQWTAATIRKIKLAQPPIPKPVVAAPKAIEPPPAPVPEPKKPAIGQRIMNGVDRTLLTLERTARRYPVMTSLTTHSVVVGVIVGLSLRTFL